MGRERGFLNEKFSMLQDWDIPVGPYRVHGIVCEMSVIESHFNAKFDCVCEGISDES